jgi:hypothetical protein
LDRLDLLIDALGGRGRLARERLDLAGHHGEAAPGVTGTSSLDRGVERQEVGLTGQLADQGGDLSDRLGVLQQAIDGLRGGDREFVRLA